MNVHIFNAVADVAKKIELPNVTPWLKNVTEATTDFASGGFKPVTKLDVDLSPGAIVKADMPGLPTRFVDDAIDVEFTEVPNQALLPAAPEISSTRTPQPYSYRQADGAGDIPASDSIKPEGGISPNQLVDSSADGTAPRTPQPYRYTKADGAGDIPGTDSITPEGGISPNQLVDSSVPDTTPATRGERITQFGENLKKKAGEIWKNMNESFTKKLEEGRSILAKGGEAAEKWAKENPDAAKFLGYTGLVGTGGVVGGVAGHNVGYTNAQNEIYQGC